jgi:hypothetical protein
LASHISYAQLKSQEPPDLICCPSVHFYDINKDLEASLLGSSSAPSSIDNINSKSDDNSGSDDDIPPGSLELGSGDNDFEIDEDIDLGSSILVGLLKTPPGSCKVGTTSRESGYING